MRVVCFFVACVACVACVTASCAITRDGKCVDYKPLASCPTGTYYQCQHTDDGCEQCSCVGEDRRGLAPGPGSP